MLLAKNTILSGAVFLAGVYATSSGGKPPTLVKGKAFDRIAIIWLENANYVDAATDSYFKTLATKGIKLTNYFAVTHPSQPNYVAAIGGDFFGMNHDDHANVPEDITSVVDLLEAKGVSWGSYQEDMPSVGFEGTEFKNTGTGKNMYVRKHNPCVLYDSVAKVPSRLNRIKPLTSFYDDLKANKLPQWMFITPNMTSNGHDTDIQTSGKWSHDFIVPLLSDKKFMQRTLVLLTFDENESYNLSNKVYTLLLGDAIPPEFVGTTDRSFYNHYSELSTVEANWDLDTLGRFDVGANVFKFVADQVGETVREWGSTTNDSPLLTDMLFGESYAGPMHTKKNKGGWAVPNVDAVYAGRKVLPAIQKAWRDKEGHKIYSTKVEIPDGHYSPKGYELD